MSTDVPPELDHRLTCQDRTLETLRQKVEQLEKDIAEIKENSRLSLEFFGAAKGAFAFFNFIGRLIKPILVLISVVSAAWVAWKTK